MKLYGKRYMKVRDVAEIDHDIIAFNVVEEDVEEVVDYLTATIITKSLMQLGESPEILE